MPKFSKAAWVWSALSFCSILVIGAMVSLTHGVTSAEQARQSAQLRADLEERTRLALWRMDSIGAALAVQFSQAHFPDPTALDPSWTGTPSPNEPSVRQRFVLNHRGHLIAPLPHSSPISSSAQLESFVLYLSQHALLNPPSPSPASADLPSSPSNKLPLPLATSQNDPAPAASTNQATASNARENSVYQVQSNVAEKNYRTQAVESTLSANYPTLEKKASPAPKTKFFPPKKHRLPSAIAATPIPKPNPPSNRSTTLDSSLAKAAPAHPSDSDTHKKKLPAAGSEAPAADDFSADHHAPTANSEAHPPTPTPPATDAPQPPDLPPPPTPQPLSDSLAKSPPPTTPPAVLGPMQFFWHGNELFLIRKVISHDPSVPSSWQGVWLNSQWIQNRLVSMISDLLPNAELLPLLTPLDGANDPMSLASFPFRLQRPDPPSLVSPFSLWPLDLPLLVAWLSVALAFLMSAVLIHHVLKLSERRASFVSAVTHELRTPLTTFRLYSEMLESGMVKPEKRNDYLHILTREADRLSHLVENVLAFSRIERGNARASLKTLPIAEFLENQQERLESRLAAANLSLTIQIVDNPHLTTDFTALDHILFNLIDNAAKYAASSNPPVVTIQVTSHHPYLHIVVKDSGPGIPTTDHKRIFRAFHKSAHQAAESKPGVGLGLSLSQRLARELHGNLELIPSSSGAHFQIKLPLVRPS